MAYDSTDLMYYSLLGTGFLIAPMSADVDSMVSRWIAQHPLAIATPIGLTGPMFVDQPNTFLVFIWITDGDEDLNITLIRQGVIPGNTMVDPLYFSQLLKSREHEPYNKSTVDRRFISDSLYFSFLQRAMVADSLAQHERLGIWSSKKN
jgi:hypothetical protein